MDTDKIFTLDKPILTFRIFPQIQSSSTSKGKSPISDCKVTVTNITTNYIAFRVHLNTPTQYQLTPNYMIIPPKSPSVITILYFRPNGPISSQGHKFKFEAIIIDEADKDQPPKSLFTKAESSSSPVKKSEIRLIAEFIQVDENCEERILTEEIPKKDSKKSDSELLESFLLNSKILSELREANKGALESMNEEDKRKSVDKLKNEYNELKKKLNDLNDEALRLKITLDSEKVNQIGTKGSKLYKF